MAAIIEMIERKIAPFDPSTMKILLELNMKWI